jgi:RNA polymerase sigma factor (sigma-70 family)
VNARFEKFIIMEEFIMTKTILMSNGQALEMTFEEVREKFAPMVIKAMKRANNKFVFNQVEEEDFRQELELELWRAYEAYDPSTGNCFSTYLHYKLQKGVRNVTYSRYSLKNQHNGILSMHAPVGEDDLKLEDMFATDDTSMDNIAFHELFALIRNNVSKEEEDVLKVLLNKKEFSVVDYANKYGITRQAANQRVNKLRKKLQQIIAREYLEII